MEIAKSVVVKIMIIMSLLIIIENRVHCSTQLTKASPNSYLDRVTHKLESYKPISFNTSHCSVHVDQFSPDYLDPEELERGTYNIFNFNSFVNETLQIIRRGYRNLIQFLTFVIYIQKLRLHNDFHYTLKFNISIS